MKKANNFLLLISLLLILFAAACRATDCGCP